MADARDLRRAWDVASHKYVEETDAVLSMARADGGTLLPIEQELLRPVLARRPTVVHLQSGNGTDDLALTELGAASVIGVDFSRVAVGAAAARAALERRPVFHVVADALAVPLADGSADLMYTGKGALMWLPDLGVWAREVHRLLRPGGTCFVYEAHPAAALWTRDHDRARLDPSVDYFGGTRENATFPASATYAPV